MAKGRMIVKSASSDIRLWEQVDDLARGLWPYLFAWIEADSTLSRNAREIRTSCWPCAKISDSQAEHIIKQYLATTPPLCVEKGNRLFFVDFEESNEGLDYFRLKKWREKQKQDETDDNNQKDLKHGIEVNRSEVNRIKQQPLYDPVAFEMFWATYPKRKSKGFAIDAWNSLNPTEELKAQILASLSKQKNSEAWVKENGAYIPNPAKWLEGRCWEDETTTQIGTAKPIAKKCGRCPTTMTFGALALSKDGKTRLCSACEMEERR